jgi:predicted PurR-regulated permease PerM
MPKLFGILFSMVATTLMGIGVVVALTTGFTTLQPILIAAVIGFVLSLPATWVLARQIEA